VECASPKYVKGNYGFAKLEDVFNVLLRIKGFPRGYIGHWLLNIAKDGRIDGVYTARYGLKIESDFHNYALAQKIARALILTPKVPILHMLLHLIMYYSVMITTCRLLARLPEK
jgi:hypothetical protein